MTEWNLTPKPVADSQVELAQVMNIADTNVAGIVHGGTIMKLVDTAAGLAAIKHSGGMCVTVSLDEMSFLAAAVLLAGGVKAIAAFERRRLEAIRAGR